MTRMKVSVSGKQFVFPRQCACCGAYPVTSLPVMGREANRNARTKGWAWDVPYCKACKRHILVNESAMAGGLVLLGLSLVSGVLVYLIYESLALALLVCIGFGSSSAVLGFGLLQFLKLSSPPMCQGKLRAVSYLGASGSCHSFDFKSRRYASEFVRANKFKLVNASAMVASILREAKFGEEQVPRRMFGPGNRYSK